MTDGHCFISYSTADALEFARQLADELEGGEDKLIKTWFDKRDIDPARDWDEQIAEGIRSCKCMLFVMTADSVMPNSMCKNEWNWALRYKKPVVPIRLHPGIEQPFGLGNRQWIDFTSEFRSGLAKLRKFIRRMDEPEGTLDSLSDRLADAERDLHRARPEDVARIKQEMDDLKEQIKRQEEIVRNPKAAEEKTEKNIQNGLERERQPERPVAGKTSTRFINPPPGIAPNYFQDRLVETQQIRDFLNNDSQRLMTIVGRAGVGKTAMSCRLLKGIENGILPDELGEMKADGIVYLSETGSHRINFANIFADLSKLLPNETAIKLEGLYKDPQTPTGDKMRKLLDAFESGHFILLLDNFENLIDSESLHIKDSELSDALNALLQATQHTVKVIITTRIAPRDLALVEPGRQHPLSLDEGLESPYAENVLREMDADGRVGLKTAPDALLKVARERTRGYPRALEALYAILSVDRYTTLEELLEISLPDEVVQKLVGEAFNRLDPSAQKVMQALAVYNRPVSPAAIDYLLQPHLPSIDSALVLNRLVNMHFARREAGRYYLHPADKEYAFSIIPEGEKRKEERTDSDELRFTQYTLLHRAADYFAQARKPRTEWKKLDDLNAPLAEFDLHCAAGDYDTAATVLREIDAEYLLLWGHYLLTIERHNQLLGKINDPYLKMTTPWLLGLAYENIGEIQKAISHYEQVLTFARERKDRRDEAASLGNLGNAYTVFGDTRKAIEFHEQALIIAQEIGDRGDESAILGNLGSAYADLGDVHKAIEYYEQALIIAREVGDQKEEGDHLCNLGNRHADLDDVRKAFEYYEQALVIDREIGDRLGEASDLVGIGLVLLSMNENEKTVDNFMHAIQIADEISYTVVQNEGRWGLAQAYLFKNNVVHSRSVVQTALQYDVLQNNHNATALHGIIALRQGERETAQEAFMKSIAQADEILAKTPDFYSALDAKGLALCGLALCAQDDGQLTADDGRGGSRSALTEAVETFRKARKIAPHAGVVKRVLRLFDELVKCDEEGMLKDVRDAIAGNK